MLFDKSVLVRYSEFLDQQGLVVGEGGVTEAVARRSTGEDKRSHEQLVQDFLTSQGETEHTLPAGWYEDFDSVRQDLERKLAGTEEMLRLEQAERVSAQRLLTDRASYVPREELDRWERGYQVLDKAYAEAQAALLRRDLVEQRLNEDVTMLKTRLVDESARLREILHKAWGMVQAGTFGGWTNEDAAAVFYNLSKQSGMPEWDNAMPATRLWWTNFAKQAREKFSRAQSGTTVTYRELAEDNVRVSRQLERLAVGIRELVPGFQWEDDKDPVEAALAVISVCNQFGQFAINVARSVWPPAQTMLQALGWQWDDAQWAEVEEWDDEFPFTRTETRVEATDQDPRWLAMIAAGRVGGEEGADAVCEAYSLGIERGVERATPVNAVEGADAAARRYAGELQRLAQGLGAVGIELREGPIDSAPVDTALHVLGDWHLPRLGLARTRELLDELRARGDMESGAATSEDAVVLHDMHDVARRLLDTLPDNVLRYRTAGD
jgi:hypothetical protein